METVKVDTQKLQLLNERIVQALDALNMLRLSAHGIQQFQQPWSPSVFGYGGYGTYPPYSAYNPFSFAPPAYVPPTYSSFPGYPIPHASSSPIVWTLPMWGAPGVSNGASHASWRPEWQARNQQTWPYASAE